MAEGRSNIVNLVSFPDMVKQEPNNPFDVLYISPLPIYQVDKNQLTSYAQRYGDLLRDAEARNVGIFYIGEIFFKSADSSIKMLFEKNHRIFDENVNFWCQSTAYLAQCLQLLRRSIDYPQVQSGGTPILNLNQHCLIEIFSYLSLQDLLSLSETCTRFRDIVPLAFTTAHKKIELEQLFWERKRQNSFEVKKIFVKFGDILTDLTFRKYQKRPEYLLSIIADCCGRSLKTLSLVNLNIDDIDREISPNIRALFSNLESLTLINCTLDKSQSARVFSQCNALVSLQISDNDFNLFDMKPLLKLNFPKLKSVFLDIYETLSLEEFFQNHKNLEKITVRCKDSTIYNCFSNYSGKNLKSLSLQSPTAVDGSMSQQFRTLFDTLNNISLDWVVMSRTAVLFSNNIQLTEVDFHTIWSAQATEIHFSQLESLTIRCVDNPPFIGHVIPFLKKHHDLKKIDFYFDHDNLIYISDILKFIVETKKFKKLQFLKVEDNISSQETFTWFNHLANLKNVEKLKLYCSVINPGCARAMLKFFKEMVSLKSLELITDEISPQLIIVFAKLTSLRRFDLTSDFRLHSPVPGGPISILTDLIIKLSHIPFLNIDLREIILAPKTIEKLGEIAHRNKQKLTINPFYDGPLLEPCLMFEMELNVDN